MASASPGRRTWSRWPSCLALLTLGPIAASGWLALAGLLVGDETGLAGSAEDPSSIARLPLVSFPFALLCTGLLSPLAMLLQLLQGQRRFPNWLPLAASLPVAFALITGVMIALKVRIQHPSDWVSVALVSLTIAACFWAYWAPLMASGTILEVLRRLRARRP